MDDDDVMIVILEVMSPTNRIDGGVMYDVMYYERVVVRMSMVKYGMILYSAFIQYMASFGSLMKRWRNQIKRNIHLIR